MTSRPGGARATVSLAMAHAFWAASRVEMDFSTRSVMSPRQRDFDHLALVVEDGVVGGLQPYLSPVTQTHESPDLMSPSEPRSRQKWGCSGRTGVTEETMMLADHLFQPVTKAVEEILVGGDDGAIGLEIDDRQGLVQGCQQAWVRSRVDCCWVTSEATLAIRTTLPSIYDGEIGRLQPHGLAGFRLANEAAAAWRRRGADPATRCLVILGIDVVGEAEGAVMLGSGANKS